MTFDVLHYENWRKWISKFIVTRRHAQIADGIIYRVSLNSQQYNTSAILCSTLGLFLSLSSRTAI